MLEPEFLDVIIERFVKEDSVVAPESRESPPFNNSLLTYIALLKIHRKATLEQIVILLKFLFPALSRYRLPDTEPGPGLDISVDISVLA